MDPLTHAALGAALGKVLPREKKDNKAVIWGAVVSILPDLDVIPGFINNNISSLIIHRGPTHSLLLTILAAPILAYLINRIHKNKSGSQLKQWTILVLSCLLVHILLDCLTSYGTQLFYPFSNLRVTLDIISVVDPLFTVPLLLALICSFLFRKIYKKSYRFAGAGLLVCMLYLGFAVTNSFRAAAVFEEFLQKKNIQYSRLLTNPTILNNVLWQGVVEQKDQYLVGLYSFMDSSPDINFVTIPKNRAIIKEIRDRESINKLVWFSNNYFVMSKEEGTIMFNDLRFGISPKKETILFNYTFKLFTNNTSKEITMRRSLPKRDPKDFEALLNRIMGRKEI
ncbi:MAG: metal-dependent hydrolase [bacterium]|nr:metal-dependent hydrolase [bacterium]